MSLSSTTIAIVYHHIESHSDSAKFHDDNSTSSLYKLLVHVLLLEVHVYISNTGYVGTLVGIYHTTTVCITTIKVYQHSVQYSCLVATH